MFGNQPGGHSGRGSPWRPRAKHEDCRRYRSGDLRLCDLVSPMEVATESRQFVQDVQSRPEPAPGETLYFTSIHSRADPQLFDDDFIDIHKTIRGIGVFVFEHTDL